MEKSDHPKILWVAYGWIGVCTVLRLAYSGTFLLMPDETNYWQWSRYLDWGYYDHPPMIAWAIKLGTLLLGHTETGVRLAPVLSMAAASVYMVLIAQRWLGARTAFWVSLFSQSVPLFNAGAVLTTTDGLQAMAWAGAAYHVAKAYECNRWHQWLLGGLWFGTGMLSKYTMVIFLPCAFLFGLFSRDFRPRLKHFKPYSGVMTGLVLFVPVVLWNLSHGWSSVRHTAYIGGADQSFSIHWNYFFEFLGSQAAVLNPLVFLLILMAWIWTWRASAHLHWIYRYLFFTSVPVFLLFAFLSLHARMEANWPGAAYLTACVLAAGCANVGTAPMVSRLARASRGLFPWAVGTSYGLSMLILLHASYPVFNLSHPLNRIEHEFTGWDVLGRKAWELKGSMPNPEKTFLFGTHYQEASEMAFYAPTNPYTVSINKWSRPNVYDDWWTDEDLMGWDAVGVTYDNNSHQNRLSQVFQRVAPPVPVVVYPPEGLWPRPDNVRPLKVFYLYRAYGFKGGLRWDPPDKDDVRVR